MDARVEDLQRLVDEAGAELGRPVALEDRNLRLLAFSAHGERDVDPVRASTILQRVNADAEVTAWFEAHGALRAEHPTRVRGNPRLGLRARVCAPVRCQGHLLGYLWLTDEHEAVSESQLARMEQIAAAAGVVIYRNRLLRHLDRGRERALLRHTLSDDELVRRDAAARLVELGAFEPEGPLTVIVIGLSPLPDGRLTDALRVAVDVAADRVRRRLAPNQSLHLVRGDHLVVLVSLTEPTVRAHGAVALAERLLAGALAALPRDGIVRRAAVGGTAPELASAWASYAQALQAARVAATVAEPFGDVVAWDDLGVYRLLVQLPAEQLDVAALHPGLRTLLEQPSRHILLHTLERYLDLAGDAQATAAALHVHRTTLHHRLRRVQEIAGANLRSGDERLTLQLGLKIARLQGRRWTDSTGDERPPDDVLHASRRRARGVA
jgi:hypothetical protein